MGQGIGAVVQAGHHGNQMHLCAFGPGDQLPDGVGVENRAAACPHFQHQGVIGPGAKIHGADGGGIAQGHIVHQQALNLAVLEGC